MANLIYNSFKAEIQEAVINLESDTIKMMLVGADDLPQVGEPFNVKINRQGT